MSPRSRLAESCRADLLFSYVRSQAFSNERDLRLTAERTAAAACQKASKATAAIARLEKELAASKQENESLKSSNDAKDRAIKDRDAALAHKNQQLASRDGSNIDSLKQLQDRIEQLEQVRLPFEWAFV